MPLEFIGECTIIRCSITIRAQVTVASMDPAIICSS